MKRFSLKRLSVEGHWEGLLYWGPWKMCYERLRMRTFLSLGAPLFPRGVGIRRGGLYTGDFEW